MQHLCNKCDYATNPLAKCLRSLAKPDEIGQTLPVYFTLWRPLRTNTDRNTGRGPPEWNRQTGTMAELGALESMAVQGAQEAMVELGALEAMAV